MSQTQGRRRIVLGALRWNNQGVPLSDDENRILREIEAQLQTDERFASAVSPKGLYLHSARTIRRAVVGMVLCLAGLVAGLQVHYLVAFLGFIGMLACGLIIERQVRLIGRAGIQDLAQQVRLPRVPQDPRRRSRPGE